MSISLRAAVTAGIGMGLLAGVGGLTGNTSLVARDLPEQAESSLLPRAAIEAALAEEKQLPVVIEAPVTQMVKTSATTEKLIAEDLATEGETAVSAPIANGESLSVKVSRLGSGQTSGREQECLAGAVYFESKGEPLAGQLAVAQVILNRTTSGRFPSSVCGVVFQRSQFSFVRGNSFPPIARGSQQWKEAVGVARVAQQGLHKSDVGKALFFHARYVSPGWKLARVGTIGNHVFYR
jgi:N-acetylmuramoyl-L-alanine amidase